MHYSILDIRCGFNRWFVIEKKLRAIEILFMNLCMCVYSWERKIFFLKCYFDRALFVLFLINFFAIFYTTLNALPHMAQSLLKLNSQLRNFK